MNARQAMELLLEGKKIRGKVWIKGTHMYLDKFGDLVNSLGRKTDFSSYDDFEEYEELTDFPTAMNHIANGGKAKRKNWNWDISVNVESALGKITFNDSAYSNYEVEKNDILATDWILL